MKKNQMRTPGPRWCGMSISPLPFVNSFAMALESRPLGPGTRSMEAFLNADFFDATSLSRSLIFIALDPASLYLAL